MAIVNGFKMDDIIDLVTDSRVQVDINDLFALIKSAAPVKNTRPKVELLDLLSGNWQ